MPNEVNFSKIELKAVKKTSWNTFHMQIPISYVLITILYYFSNVTLHEDQFSGYPD